MTCEEESLRRWIRLVAGGELSVELAEQHLDVIKRTARSEGYVQAKEQAAAIMARWPDLQDGLDAGEYESTRERVARRIRAMELKP